jgi:hypothetical protein
VLLFRKIFSYSKVLGIIFSIYVLLNIQILDVCIAQFMNIQSDKLKHIVVLQGLDKVTARIKTFHASTEEKTYFGTLTIQVRSCYKNPPTETPESAVFIEITDNVGGELVRVVFSGWMFSSSPALSALEHPIYDIWVVDCINSLSSINERLD